MFLYSVIDSASVSTHSGASNTLISGGPKNLSDSDKIHIPRQQNILSLCVIGQSLIQLLSGAGAAPLQREPHLGKHIFWGYYHISIEIKEQKRHGAVPFQKLHFLRGYFLGKKMYL